MSILQYSANIDLGMNIVHNTRKHNTTEFVNKVKQL